MRVVSSSAAALVLAHRPLVVPGIAAALVIGVIVQTIESAPSLGPGEWVAAGAGILVGSLVSYLSALPSRVVFDAARGDVRWQHFGWPGRVRGSCPLGQVTGVELLADSSGAQRLALSTSAGVVPLTRNFLGFEPHARHAAAIREWLALHERGAASA